MVNTTAKQKKLSTLIQDSIRDLNLPERPSTLYDPVRYTLSLGGKRIRPYFTLTGCGLCGGEVEEALPAAMAIELLHNFTLLHDDIMDAADTRRGKESVYRKWNASTAILSGDAMYAWAFEQLQYYGSTGPYTKEQYARIIHIFLESARTVCEGQAYDLEFENVSRVTADEYFNMINGKTAALISAAFELGGAVAGAGDKQLERLREMGTQVGVAFQIQDDLLDVVADPSKFGKVRGGDIAESKKTYLSVLTLEKGDEKQTNTLKEIFDKPEVSRSDIEKVIDVYTSLGILESAKVKIEELYENAVHRLDEFPDSAYKEDLKTFLSNLINREY